MPARLREHIHPRELLYPANWLSALRLALVPAAAVQLRRGRRRLALLISALAIASDMVDGIIARRRGEISNLGKILDPIADKLFINSMALALAARGELPRWVARLLLLRDAAILVGSILLFRRRSEIVVSQWFGKVTTGLLGGSLLLFLLDNQRWGRRMLDLALVTMFLSLLQYGGKFLRLMYQVAAPALAPSPEEPQA